MVTILMIINDIFYRHDGDNYCIDSYRCIRFIRFRLRISIHQVRRSSVSVQRGVTTKG